MKISVIISGLLLLSFPTSSFGMPKPTNNATSSPPQACTVSAANAVSSSTCQQFPPEEKKVKAEENENKVRRTVAAINIDALMERGEKLDILYYDKSETLEGVSRNFYRKKPSWFDRITAYFSGKK